jgi:acyl carrier protein
MKEKEFYLFLEDALAEKKGSLKPETRLDSLQNWDSMGVVSATLMVEEKFEMVLEPDQLSHCKTVQGLFQFIQDQF